MAKSNRRVNIIADSCCDLPCDLFKSLGIGLLRFPYLINGVEYFDDMYETSTPHQFFERLRKGEEAKTAQIPYVQILEMFEKAAQEPLPTVVFSFSSGLSGNCETMKQACAETLEKHPGAELYVVDTLLPSIAEGFLVWEAVRQADRGLSAKELVAWAEEARYFVNGYFTIPDFETLKRGGRIPDIAAMAGATLDIKPIITIDLEGRLKLFAAARGRKKSIKLMLQLYEERARDVDPNVVIVASADATKELKQMTEQLLKKKASTPPAIISSSVGPVIGAHVGPDMMVLVFWGPDRRESVSLTDKIANAVTSRSDSIRARIRGYEKENE